MAPTWRRFVWGLIAGPCRRGGGARDSRVEPHVAYSRIWSACASDCGADLGGVGAGSAPGATTLFGRTLRPLSAGLPGRRYSPLGLGEEKMRPLRLSLWLC